MTPSRRKFVASLSVVMAGVAIPSLGWAIGKKKKKKADKKAGGDSLKLIDMSDKSSQAVKTATGLNYVSDVQKAIKSSDITVKEKGGVKPANQKCQNCVLAVKDGDNYKCQVIQGVYVHANGWCTSWNPKQG